MTQKSKPRIFSSDLAQLPIALQWLTKQRRWVVWRWVMRVTGWRQGEVDQAAISAGLSERPGEEQ